MATAITSTNSKRIFLPTILASLSIASKLMQELSISNSLSNDDEDAKDSLLMRLFLGFATTAALRNNTLQPYTTEMSETAHKLIEGVQLED